jgi:hypothetical protein
LRRQLLFHHPKATDLLALATRDLPPMQAAWVEGHLDVCTICHRFFTRATQDLADERAQRPSLWMQSAPTAKRLIASITLVSQGLGRLMFESGPCPLPSPSGAATMATKQEGLLKWRLIDDAAHVDIQLAVAGSTATSSPLEIRARAIAVETAELLPGRLEIVDDLGATYLSGPLHKLAALAARVPCGKWLVRIRVSVDGHLLTWEIAIDAKEASW